MNHMRITTAELARICGVSQGTVDRALNGRKGISQKTKERILKTASAYGFREVAGNTKCGETMSGQIGVIVFNLNNDYFCKLITEIESACRKIGYATTVMFTDYDKQHEIETIRRMYRMGAEGIILCAVNYGPEFEAYLKEFDIPIVAVANDIPSLPYVGIDDFQAMKMAAEYVGQKSCRNLIYFSPAIQYEENNAQKRRLEGFMAGLPKDISYSVITDIEKIREEYPEETIIICSTDYYALEVFFKTKGARIIGIDNIDILDRYRIPITSVGYSITEIAQGAVELILTREKEKRIVDFYLVER